MTESVEELCQRGRTLIRSKNFPSAVEVFTRAATQNPDCCEAHEGLATCAFLSGNYAESIAQYAKLTLLQPMESRYYTNLGAIHNRIGDHMKAADFLRKAIQRNKKSAEAFYNLGIAQRKLKQNSMAVSAYKEAIKLDPMMVEAYQNLGNVYVDMGNLQMAVANFKKAIEIKPDFDKARVGLEKAEEQLNQAKIKNNPFGRLAAISSAATSVTSVSVRELREEERQDDRKFIKQISDEIERLGKGCVDHLKQRVVPAILDVERAMAHGAEEVFTLSEASDAFKEATSQWSTLRRTLKKKLQELREHENFMKVPNGK